MTDTHTQTPMFRVQRGPHIVGTIRASDLTTHGELLVRAKYELAQMVGGQLARSILRGIATQYSDGTFSVRPTDGNGHHSRDTDGNIISYWFTPYTI